jgi:hypothetical protein
MRVDAGLMTGTEARSVSVGATAGAAHATFASVGIGSFVRDAGDFFHGDLTGVSLGARVGR